MIWKRFLVSILVMNCSSAISQPFAVTAADPPRRIQHDSTFYRGVVSAIGVDWVELGAGWTGARRFDSMGRDITKKRHDETKSLRITAEGTIPGGNPKGDGLFLSTYRLSDLKIGDVVSIETGINTDTKEEWTIEIWLYRRPGGIIPPRPGEVRSDLNGWHMRMQAEQDWEEKGIPIPAQFLSDGRAPWTNPPYPPVAPLPREVPQKPAPKL